MVSEAYLGTVSLNEDFIGINNIVTVSDTVIR